MKQPTLKLVTCAIVYLLASLNTFSQVEAQIIATESNESTLSDLTKVKLKRELDNGIRSMMGVREPTPAERKQRKMQLKKKIAKREKDLKREFKLNADIDKKKNAQVPLFKKGSRNALQKHLAEDKNIGMIDSAMEQVSDYFSEFGKMVYGTKDKDRRMVKALDPIDFEPKEPFSNSTEYLYFQAFMQGLNLANNFPSSTDCVDNLVYWSDENTIFENNFTYEVLYTPTDQIRPINPLLAWTKVIGGNFSESVPNCYKMSEEIYDYWYALWISVNSSFNDLLISWLFSQMTYAIIYKQALDRMQENEETQNYISNMTQWGIIVNLLLLSVEARLAGLDWDVITHAINQDGDEYQDEQRPEVDQDLRIEDYMTFGNAWNQINRRVPKDFFNPTNSQMALSSKVQYGITVGCALGIAYIAQLNRQGTQLVDVNQIGAELQNLMQDPIEQIKSGKLNEGESLNLWSLIKEDQVEQELEEIMKKPNFDARVDVALDYLLDHFSVKDGVQRILIKSNVEPIIHQLMNTIPGMYKRTGLPPQKSRNTPFVQAEKIVIPVDEWSDFYWAALGFKDGVVFQTGTDTKIYLCNGNLSAVDDVFYRDWLTIYGSDVFPTNFYTSWRVESLNTANLIKSGLQWPYLSLFSCYWSLEDLVFRYSNQDVPLSFQPKQEDGTYGKVGFIETTILNAIFNTGFIINDFIYLLDVTNDIEQSQWFYRNGFVTGDIYMRFFYRSLASAKLKLKSDS